MVGDRGQRDRARQREPAGLHRFDRDQLAGQGGLHVHDAVAVDGAIDEVARERGRPLPAVGLGLGVQVAGEYDPWPGPEADLPDGVGPSREHVLQLHRLETGFAHDRGEESGQLSLAAQDAGDPADLPHQLHRPVEVEMAQDCSGRSRVGLAHRHPFFPTIRYWGLVSGPAAPLATPGPAWGRARISGRQPPALQLYGMYLSVAISEALGVILMSLFCFIQLP